MTGLKWAAAAADHYVMPDHPPETLRDTRHVVGAVRSWVSRSDRRWWGAVFLVAWATYLLTAHWQSGQVNDTQAAIWPAWNFVHHGSFFLDGVRDLPDLIWFAPVHGHLVSNRMMGVVISGVPVSAALSWTPLTPEQLNALNGSLYAAVAVASLSVVFRRIAPDRVAAAATVVMALGTSLWTVAAAETWPQSVDAMWLSLALLAVSRGRLWWAGAALMPALMTRPHIAVAALLLGAGLAVTRRSPRPLAAIGVPTSLSVMLLVLWNHWMFDRWNIGGAYVTQLDTATSVPTSSGLSDLAVNAAGAFFGLS